MCLNCGCMEPHESHGNDANITYEDVKAAAEANGMSVDETVRTIQRTVEHDRQMHASEYAS